ncbi:hypothetical protein [Streptomyces sp. SYSU K217416]
MDCERADAAEREAVKRRKRASFLNWLAEGGLPALTDPPTPPTDPRPVVPGCANSCCAE